MAADGGEMGNINIMNFFHFHFISCCSTSMHKLKGEGHFFKEFVWILAVIRSILAPLSSFNFLIEVLRKSCEERKCTFSKKKGEKLKKRNLIKLNS